MARPCASIFRTNGNIIGAERDRDMPRDASSSERRYRASFQIPTFVATSVYPTRIGNQNILSPSHLSIAKSGRNAKPFDASIIVFSAVHEHSTSYFSGLIDVETFFAEVADIKPRERINFASNSVFGENPNSVDLGLSPAHTTDKLKSVIGPATRAEVCMDHYNWLASRHRIA